MRRFRLSFVSYCWPVSSKWSSFSTLGARERETRKGNQSFLVARSWACALFGSMIYAPLYKTLTFLYVFWIFLQSDEERKVLSKNSISEWLARKRKEDEVSVTSLNRWTSHFFAWFSQVFSLVCLGREKTFAATASATSERSEEGSRRPGQVTWRSTIMVFNIV